MKLGTVTKTMTMLEVIGDTVGLWDQKLHA